MLSTKLITLLLIFVASLQGFTPSVYAKQQQQVQQLININQADVKTLMSIKGIGKRRAKALVAYRDAHGPFKQIGDLQQIKGYSKKFIDKLKAKIKL